MSEIGIGLVALAAGIIAGVLLIGLRRRPGAIDGASRLDARLEVQAAELRRLADAAAARDGVEERLRADVAGARRALEEISVREQERRARQTEDSDAIRRLSTVLAGGAGTGRAGENVLREHLSQLPPAMLVTDFRVNGKVVEYGLLLSDGRRLPVDSKWPAAAELEALDAATDPAVRDARARDVERTVATRAREVA